MWKKIGATVLLSSTLMLGGLFSTSAEAAVKNNQQPVQIYSNIYYSINDNTDSESWNQVNNIWKQFLTNWQTKTQYPSQQKPQKNTDKKVPQPEETKQEQPETQQPTEQPTEAVPEQEETNNQIDQLGQFEQQVVALTNVEREKNGLAPLTADKELSRVAREKSRNMAQIGYFDHNSPTYGSPFDMMQAYGIDYRTAGENIAKGQRTPEEVVNAWMNSPGHRANILNDNFTHIGVGYVEQGNHWTQMFTGK